jgi:uncharacterized membrane protein required for colicin V production
VNEIIRDYIWILWDVLAVVIFALFAFVSAERGLVRTLISFGGYIIAALLADLLSPMLAGALYDGVVKDAIRLVILSRVGNLAQDATADVSSAIPEGLARLMESDSATSLSSVLGAEAGGIVDELIDAALRDPVLSILSSVCFLLVFTVVLLLTRHLSRLFRGMYRVPLLGTADTVLGGVAGIFEGAVVLVVASLVLRVLIGVSGGWVWVNDSVMEGTYIWRIFWNTTSFLAGS